MSDAISVMKRYEIKYILNKEQILFLTENLKSYMEVDKYGKTSIASLYYDTSDYRLIRESVEKNNYKEKIRIRSYGLNKEGMPLYLELKRKVSGIVYKRRIETNEKEINDFFQNKSNIFAKNQIGKEITYFRDFYNSLIPACLIIYDRVAYFEKNGDLRLTIDHNPRYRVNDLNLSTSLDGISLLPEGYAILEVKVQDSIPLWLCNILSKGKIYKNSFSKYGEAYKREILNIDRKEMRNYV